MASPAKIIELKKVAQALFMLNVVIWVILGILSLARITKSPVGTITRWVIGILMFGNAGAMLLSAIGIGRGGRAFYYFALAVLAVNIVLTFTDQFGVYDLLTLIIDVILLGLLIADRKRITAPNGALHANP